MIMEKDVQESLIRHCIFVEDYLKENGYNKNQLLGVFVYGSQNYGVATEQSDVDTKAVIIPTIQQLAFNPIKTKTLVLPNGEHCEVMSITHYIDNLTKQNINFVETVFTHFCYINPVYQGVWVNYFINKRERICRYDQYKCLLSTYGQALHTLKQNPLNGKKISNIARLRIFLDNYLKGKRYDECIKPTAKERESIIALKQKEVLENSLCAEMLEDQLKELKEEYEDKVTKEKDIEVLADIQNAALQMIYIADAIVGGK